MSRFPMPNNSHSRWIGHLLLRFPLALAIGNLFKCGAGPHHSADRMARCGKGSSFLPTAPRTSYRNCATSGASPTLSDAQGARASSVRFPPGHHPSCELRCRAAPTSQYGPRWSASRKV